jgi:hypothetical protein
VSNLSFNYVRPGVPNLSWTPPASTLGVTGYTVSVNYTVYTSTFYLTYHTTAPTTNVDLTGLTTDNVVIFVTVAPNDAQGYLGLSTPSTGFLYSSLEPNVGWAFNQPAAIAGEPMSVQFTDYSGHPSTWSLVSGPAGMTVDSTTGLLTWTPSLASVGNVSATVLATNGPFSSTVVVNFPVYFTNAPTAVSVVKSFDPVSGLTTYDLSWAAPTANPDSIAGYQIAILLAGSPPGAAPLIFQVPASDLSVMRSIYRNLSGSVQVTAIDAAGDLGVASDWVTF